MTTAPTTVPLADGELACAACGVAVPGPHRRSAVIEVNLGIRWHGQTPRPLVVPFTRCAACAVRHEHAATLIELYPAIARAQGGREVALERFDAVLSLGDLLLAPVHLDGMVTGNVSAIASARELALLLQHALAPALALAFAHYAEARQGLAATTPWATVTPELRSTARTAMAAWLRARIAPQSIVAASPVPFGADVLGCVLCGVATATAWREIDVSPRALGGRASAEKLAGVACPVCAEAIQRHGVGMTALTAALLAHAGVRRLGGVEDLEVGLVGFAAQPLGTPPSAEPFAGVDFEALRRDVGMTGVTA